MASFWLGDTKKKQKKNALVCMVEDVYTKE
jgi:hypothetical protein